MKEKKWSQKFDCCTVCLTNNNRHLANGLCLSCHSKVKYKRNKHKEVKKLVRKYEWSLNYEYCITCKGTENKHYWKWLCGICRGKAKYLASKSIPPVGGLTIKVGSHLVLE